MEKINPNETIFTGTVEVLMNVALNESPKLKEVNFNLKIPKPGLLSADAYLTEDELPTAAGAKMLSNAFIQGIVGNIKTAHAAGLWSAAEHLLWVHEEITRAMAADSEIAPGENHFKT